METSVPFSAPATRMRDAALVTLVIAVGIALRIWLVGFVHPIDQSIYSDMENYVRMSESVLAGRWDEPLFFQPIGYPVLLAGLRLLTDDWLPLLGALQIVASSATMILVWRAAAHSFGRGVGLVTLTVAAVHLPWITYAGFAFAETFFTLVLAVLALIGPRLTRSPGVRLGLLWGAVFFLALLLKGTHIFVVVVFLLGLLLLKKRASWKAVIAISLSIWIGLLAHGAFTRQTIGRFQMTASAGGLNFVEGKCPVKANEDSAGAVWLSPLYYQLGKTDRKTWDRPFTDSGFYFSEGLRCILQNPLVLVQSIEGIPFLIIGNWMWPSNNLSYWDWIRLHEMAFAIFSLVGLSAFALLVLPRQDRDRMLAWTAPLIGLVLCVYVFKSEVRFRVPFDVWIIPLAAAGWQALWQARPRGPQ